MAGNDKEFEPTRSRRSVNAGSEGRSRAKKRRGLGVFSGRRRAADQSASGVSEQRPDNRRNPFVHAKNKDHPLGWSFALAYVFEWICEHYWKAAANHAIHKNVVKLDTL